VGTGASVVEGVWVDVWVLEAFMVGALMVGVTSFRHE
jgi:hypothetical protein